MKYLQIILMTESTNNDEDRYWDDVDNDGDDDDNDWDNDDNSNKDSEELTT